MKILLLGKTGQLGSEFNGLFQHHNYQLIDSDYLSLNLDDEIKLLEQIRILTPDLIINATAWTNVDLAESHEKEAFRVNANWPRNLSLATKNLKVPFIHFSTDYVFSGKAHQPWAVDSPRSPINVYGKTKAQGEDFIMNIYKEGSFIYRTSWLYSKYRKNFVKTIIRLALRDEEKIEVVNDQIGQPTSAKDLSNQVLKGIELGLKPGIYHATNSGHATWYDFAAEILKFIGEDTNRLIPIKSSKTYRPAARPAYSVMSDDCWTSTPMFKLQEWKMALKEHIGEILIQVKNEDNL